MGRKRSTRPPPSATSRFATPHALCAFDARPLMERMPLASAMAGYSPVRRVSPPAGMMGRMETLHDDIARGAHGQRMGEDAFQMGLDEHLEATARAQSWRVRKVLKETPFETTELVMFAGASGGELGPFVRKIIDCAAGVGSAYERLMAFQLSGGCSRYLPRLVECVRTGDTLSVVMEWVEGERLDAYLLRHGAGPELAIQVVSQLCDAVSVLHEDFDPPLIHRDLKPSNIIIRGGVPVLIDFGIARSWEEGAQADTAHFGTRCYAPPEQFGFGQTDARSDVYALGCVLHECVTGTPPTMAADADRVIDARGRAVLAVAAKARSFDPAARYPRAEDMRRALCAVGDSESGHFSDAGHAASSGVSMLRERRGDCTVGASTGGSGLRFVAFAGADRSSPSDVHPAWIPPSDPSWLEDRRPVRARWSCPPWAGRCWNIAVAIIYISLMTGAFFAAFDPRLKDQALPLWFRVLEYPVMCGTCFTVLGYLLMDRRRIRERFACCARLSYGAEIAAGFALMAGVIVFTIAVASAVGVV